MKNELVIVRTDTPIPHLHCFPKETETLESIQTQADSLPMENYNRYWHNLELYDAFTDENINRAEAMKHERYSVMTYDEFLALERSAILTSEPEEITAERYNEMLDILPPLAWHTSNGIESFCMSEFYTGSYTSQYAKVKATGKYYTKIVDYRDRSTWLENILTPEQKTGCPN